MFEGNQTPVVRKKPMVAGTLAGIRHVGIEYGISPMYDARPGISTRQYESKSIFSHRGIRYAKTGAGSRK
jgi:hypothetical protein